MKSLNYIILCALSGLCGDINFLRSFLAAKKNQKAAPQAAGAFRPSWTRLQANIHVRSRVACFYLAVL